MTGLPRGHCFPGFLNIEETLVLGPFRTFTSVALQSTLCIVVHFAFGNGLLGSRVLLATFSGRDPFVCCLQQGNYFPANFFLIGSVLGKLTDTAGVLIASEMVGIGLGSDAMYLHRGTRSHSGALALGEFLSGHLWFLYAIAGRKVHE